MTIESPESLPEDEPQGAAVDGPGTADGGIPAGEEGVGLGAAPEANTFEPEESPDEGEGSDFSI